MIRTQPIYVGVAAVLALAATSAQAQTNFPTRNITLVLPFAAGSGTDTTTRIISKELGIALNTGMIIDNKSGANGSIAASFVARAPADGYTLFVTTNTTHSANPYLLKTMSYDPIKDFTPIARTGDLPFVLVINPDIPANSVAELIALAKKEPGKYTYASGSSSAIVSGATFAKLAGIDLLHVPFRSSPPALSEVIAGRLSMMFVDTLTALPHVNAKSLKALAVTTKNRSALLPDLPSMDEAGVKGFDITSWQGYLGPANMPKDVVLKLNTEIRKIIDRP
ncbi:MAG: transporter substrate-binding protein, partial [Tardiphaga sp.]|nr:transporter substrate-binding protein [Tardiphaga sp.]